MAGGVCAQNRGWCWASSLALLLIFWDKLSHWTWSLLIQLHWLGSKLWVNSCICSPHPHPRHSALGFQMHMCSWAFMWVLEFKLRSSCSCSKQVILSASSLPHPFLFYSKNKNIVCNLVAHPVSETPTHNLCPALRHFILVTVSRHPPVSDFVAPFKLV